jgi:hypothetical protein
MNKLKMTHPQLELVVEYKFNNFRYPPPPGPPRLENMKIYVIQASRKRHMIIVVVKTFPMN